MNILDLLIKEKKVAGIEISDSVVRIVFFKPQAKKRGSPSGAHEELVLIEEPIAGNIIASGVVIDRELLGKTLKALWEKANLGTIYAIVSIPDEKIYSHIFSFPKPVEGTRLTEAMRLAIGFQLPMKTEDIYLDWERTSGTTLLNEVLLSTIPRTVAQGYIEALDLAGIKTLALESHLASIARAIQTEPEKMFLFTEKTPDGATIFALKDRVLRFSRTLPQVFVPEASVPNEVRKVKLALESELKSPIVETSLLDAKIREDYAALGQFSEPKAKWLVALGAAIRGRIPEDEDNLISLLPVGTEEAYAYQKATTFITFVRNLIVGISIFFTLAFFAAYFLVLTLSQNAERAISALSATPTSPELLAREEWVGHLNALTGTTRALLAEMPIWSILIEELIARTPDTITISGLLAPTIEGKMALTGVAQDRASLNDFKKKLQESPLLTEVELPLTNLEQKEKIPFSLSFRVLDPTVLLFK